MKISHFSYSDIVGGAFRAAYRIHQALREAGIDSTMHAIRPTSGDPTVSTPPGELFRAFSLIRPHIGAVPKLLFNTGNPIMHSPALVPSGWPRWINQSDADIIHLHWVNREMLSVGDIGRIKKPIVWRLPDMWAFCGAEHYTDDTRYRDGYTRANRPAHESGFDLNRWTWNRKRRAWRRPMHIVTASRWLGDCARQSVLMGEWPVTVIPNALDTRAWQPVEQPVARRLLGLPVDGPLLAFGAVGGGRDTRKGADLLFAALERLRGQIPGLELMVFGEHRPTQVPDVGFPIHYLGHLYDDLSLRVVYSAADAMVVPSRQEAFGLTAAEAQACGTPVIAFDIGGLPDIVKHQHSGWLAKAFDTEDLARGIQWVLASDDRREQLACHAREDAVARFSYPVVAKAYKAVYEEVLGMEQHDEPT